MSLYLDLRSLKDLSDKTKYGNQSSIDLLKTQKSLKFNDFHLLRKSSQYPC